MVEFRFSMRGYVFQQGLKDLRRAFDATWVIRLNSFGLFDHVQLLAGPNLF
jgi:hypothetical protein